ncbi:MAG: hypothetical protein KJ622_15915 [Alphaproteobacteria bacterium]|nr:hypothetical protein [Alphaproteobacteria bacterium]
MIRVLLASVVVAAAAAAIPYTTFAANIRDAAGLAAIHDLAVENGRLCMSDHPHFGQTGSWPTLAQARTSAIRSWSGFTRIEYGEDWAQFELAADPKLDCSQSATGRGDSWTCAAQARPCRR